MSASAAMGLTLVPLATMVAELRAPRVLPNTPAGTRMIYEVVSGSISGGADAPLFSTPRFETGDERYRWLNKLQAVGKGSLVGTTLSYELYELR